MKTYNNTKLLLTLCVCVCTTFAMAQQATQNDSLQLVQFYNNNCGPGCTLNWDFSQPVRNWEGIAMNYYSGTVYDIDLTNKGLTGSIPNFNLPDLGRLLLGNNQLEGGIPDFSGVPKLFALLLPDNRLNGEIPNFNLDSLTMLNLSRNNLSGEVPQLNNLIKLTSLGLASNQLTGTIPDFNTLVNLTEIHLNDNQLSGNIPDFSNLTKLNKLILTSNELAGDIPDFSTLIALRELYLGDNQLTDTIPDFNSLSELRHLHLYSNGLSGTIPDFANLVNLTNLSLNQNELTGSVPDFATSPNLVSLYLTSNQLSGVVPDFSGLNELYIYLNEFSHGDIAANFTANSTIPNFLYFDQYFGDPQFHTKQAGDLLTLSPKPSIPYQSPTIQWVKDGNYSTNPAVNDTIFTIDAMTMNDIGIYRYLFTDETLSPEIRFTSRPIYVYIEGYDLSGAPVLPGQLILDYGTDKSLAQIDSLRDDLRDNYGGEILDSCGCSITLDLWEFPADSIDQVREDLDIDGGEEKRLGDADLDGGEEKRLGDADLDGGQNRTTRQQLIYMPNNGEQISVSFSSLIPGQGSVVIGVLDTGLDTDHPDIMSNVWNNLGGAGDNDDQNCYTNDPQGYNFVNHSGGIQDDHAHGTHVGGVIAANVPAGIDVKVMPVKAFDNEGNGTMYDMICGIHYAIDNGADIINISAGYEGHKAPVFQKAIQYGREKDILFVVSAGNNSIDLDEHDYWPASFSRDTLLTNTMITVTSVDATYHLSDNVGYGDNTVTVAAQGEGVLSPTIGGGYAHFTGTSISTPLVALALGIEKTQNPNKDYTTLRNDFLNGLDAVPRLTDVIENGRVLIMGINNLANIIINPIDQCIDASADETSFSIYSDTDFQISTDADWVTISSSEIDSLDTRLDLSYDENTSTDSRAATIILTGGGMTTKGYLIQEGTTPDQTDLTINDAFINGTIYKAASNTITADNIIEIEATVRYSAGTGIVMSEGFHAKPGSSFLATIGVCEEPDNKEEQLTPQISLRSYPNPFSHQTTIEYSLSEDSEITLIISDVAGRQIAIPVNGEMRTAGTHKVVFDGTQLPSGMYYYTIKTGDYFGTQKMILAK